MPRVRFITNASCPEGVFQPGVEATLSEASARDFERQGAVKVLEEPAAEVEAPSPDAPADPAQPDPTPAVDPAPAGAAPDGVLSTGNAG
jgi:hypothetical protein